ncbi:MAG: RecX family transcriptional regulator [Clostridia bacterium]|jgi:regulatory protein|nr:RecX family transcriptional regulator [Clostridia bacterium]
MNFSNNLEELEKKDKLQGKIMKFIMYKKRTEKEVVEKFKNEDKDLLEETIEKLKELGYINDREYIERFANEAMSLKNLSIFELKYKLYSKGISDSLIDEYIESNLEMLDEYELLSAQNIYDKKKNMQDSQEIILYLRKKRYSPDTIKKLSRE